MRRYAIGFLLAWVSACAYALDVPLAWDASTSPDVTGYRIHVGTQGGVYNQVHDAGAALTYTVTGLADDTDYYFAATAYNAAAQESGFSNEVVYLAQAPPAIVPLDQINVIVTKQAQEAAIAVDFDATSTPAVGSDGYTVASWSHTFSGADNAALIAVARDSTSLAVTGVTVAGNTATLLGSVSNANSWENLSVYYYVGALSGAQTIEVTFDNVIYTRAISAISFNGVDQDSPVGVITTASGAPSANPSLTGIASAVGDLIVAFVSREDNNAMTPGTGVTNRLNVVQTYEALQSATKEGAATSTTMAWTMSSTLWAGLAVAIKPSSAAVTNTSSASIDAMIQSAGITQPVDLDALIQKQLSAQLSLDSAVQDSFSATLSADAMLQSVLSGQVSLDSLLQASPSINISIDSLLQSPDISATTVLDALLRDSLSSTVALDAVLTGGATASVVLDAFLQSGQLATISLDAALQSAGITTTGSIDAMLQAAGLSVGISLDGMLQSEQNATTSIDAVLTGGSSLTANIDALLQTAGVSSTAVLDALLQTQAITSTVIVDALLQQSKTGTVSIDALLTGAAGTNAFVSLDSLLQAARSAGTSIDAMIQAADRSAMANIDAVLQQLKTATISLDSLLQSAASTSASIDALLQVAALSATLNIDSLLQQLKTGTISIDAFLISASAVGLSLDAKLLGTNSGTLSIDAIIGVVTQAISKAGFTIQTRAFGFRKLSG